MDMGAGSRKRKSVELDSLEAGAGERTAGDQDQEPPLPAAGVDRISDLPDDVLGEIISLLPTQVLPSPWRRLWRSAPLNLHYSPFLSHEEALDVIISRILAAHPGPGRRFCAPVYHLHVDRANALLRSPALDNLHELELCSSESFFPSPPTTLEQPPAAAFRFSDTLRVATFGQCNLADATVQTLHFPKLQKLALKRVCISESSLHTLIAACPALECLLMQCISDCRCVRINSSCIRSIGVGGYNSRKEPKFEELVIENAPCLQSLLQLGTSDRLDISVISAPKLEALGYLSGSTTRLVFDSTVIQGFCVDDSSTTMVRSIKILAVHMSALSLDDVIKLMSCFPCLEKLYIQSNRPGETNGWRRKHRSLIRSLDIRLKTIVWRIYRGTESHVNFATFFLLNARVLELMTFEVRSEDYNEAFFEKQRETLQFQDSRASRGPRLRFTSRWSYNHMMEPSVHDLDPADLFERREPPEADTNIEICVWTAVSPPAEANGSSDRKKKRRADDGDGCRTCSCKKSRCLKLYCVCFASGSHCSDLCGCEPCYNKPVHGVPRNAPGLPLQVVRPAEAGQELPEQLVRSPMDIFRRKCTCKKSSCLKKYCDCYQGGAGCSINCKCDDCKNPYGKKVGVILDGPSMFTTPAANERNGTKVDSSDDDDDEDDYYMNRPLSPIPPSPVSRESSFQQETLVGVEVHTMNGHLYPKPLTQVRPESWPLSRRPAEESRGEQWRFSRRPSEDGTSDVMEGHANHLKFQRDNNSKQPETHVDNRYSITRCIEVMNAMAELSPVEKSLAPDVFLDASSREIFLSLSVDIRTMWLKRKMRSLV